MQPIPAAVALALKTPIRRWTMEMYLRIAPELLLPQRLVDVHVRVLTKSTAIFQEQGTRRAKPRITMSEW